VRNQKGRGEGKKRREHAKPVLSAAREKRKKGKDVSTAEVPEKKKKRKRAAGHAYRFLAQPWVGFSEEENAVRAAVAVKKEGPGRAVPSGPTPPATPRQEKGRGASSLAKTGEGEEKKKGARCRGFVFTTMTEKGRTAMGQHG